MNLPSFFRTYKNKQFNYIPVYYDQQKEELQERIRKIEAEAKGDKTDEEFNRSIIKGSFRHMSAYRTKGNRASSLRIVIIIAILLAFVFFLFSI